MGPRRRPLRGGLSGLRGRWSRQEAATLQRGPERPKADSPCNRPWPGPTAWPRIARHSTPPGTHSSCCGRSCSAARPAPTHCSSSARPARSGTPATAPHLPVQLAQPETVRLHRLQGQQRIPLQQHLLPLPRQRPIPHPLPLPPKPEGPLQKSSLTGAKRLRTASARGRPAPRGNAGRWTNGRRPSGRDPDATAAPGLGAPSSSAAASSYGSHCLWGLGRFLQFLHPHRPLRDLGHGLLQLSLRARQGRLGDR